MTKKEVVWLITKLIGVLFSYWMIVALFVLIGSIYAYIQLPSPPRFGKAETPVTGTRGGPTSPGFPDVTGATPIVPANAAENPAETAKNEALKQLLWDLFLVVIYGLVGWYLIRDGRFLFALLNRESPYDESGKPVESDSFPLSKKKENMVTTLNLSERPKASAPSESASKVGTAPSETVSAPTPNDATSNETAAPFETASNEAPSLGTPTENTPDEVTLEIPDKSPSDERQ